MVDVYTHVRLNAAQTADWPEAAQRQRHIVAVLALLRVGAGAWPCRAFGLQHTL